MSQTFRQRVEQLDWAYKELHTEKSVKVIERSQVLALADEMDRQLVLATNDIDILQRLYDGARATEDAVFGWKDRPSGKPQHVVHELRDRLKKVEAELAERTTELEEARATLAQLVFDENHNAVQVAQTYDTLKATLDERTRERDTLRQWLSDENA